MEEYLAEMLQSADRLCRRTSGSSGSSLSDGAEAAHLRPIGIANELLDGGADTENVVSIVIFGVVPN